MKTECKADNYESHIKYVSIKTLNFLRKEIKNYVDDEEKQNIDFFCVVSFLYKVQSSFMINNTIDENKKFLKNAIMNDLKEKIIELEDL